MTGHTRPQRPSTPHRSRRRTTIWSNLLGILVVVMLTACSDNDGADSAADTVPVTAAPAATDDDAPGDDSSSNGESPSTTRPEAVIDIVNQPGSGEFEGGVADAAVRKCARTKGRWSATGTITNPNNASVDYRIYVSFLDPGGETLALLETGVNDLGPNATADWSTGFSSDASDLRCVLRVERRHA